MFVVVKVQTDGFGCLHPSLINQLEQHGANVHEALFKIKPDWIRRCSSVSCLFNIKRNQSNLVFCFRLFYGDFMFLFTLWAVQGSNLADELNSGFLGMLGLELLDSNELQLPPGLHTDALSYTLIPGPNPHISHTHTEPRIKHCNYTLVVVNTYF